MIFREVEFWHPSNNRMAAEGESDELLTVRNLFHVGNFVEMEKEMKSLSGLSNKQAVARDALRLRAALAQSKPDLVFKGTLLSYPLLSSYVVLKLSVP